MSVKIASAAFIVMSLLKKKKIKEKTRRKRKYWIHNAFRRPDKLITNKFDVQKHFPRMSSLDFEWLLDMTRDKISKRDTEMRKAVPVHDRLAVTLQFLATGESFSSLQFLFKFSKQLISCIIPEVCKAIIEALSEYMKMPATQEEWLEISEQFATTCNFPHCLGAIDAKHIAFKNFHRGNMELLNSIILIGLVDADYNFLYADASIQHSGADKDSFLNNNNTELYDIFADNALNLPSKNTLPDSDINVPYVFVSTEALPMSANIIRKYPECTGTMKSVFNARINQPQNVVENAFGVISDVFQVLTIPILLDPKKAELIIMAIIYLHNFLRQSESSRELYTPEGIFDHEKDGKWVEGKWRKGKSPSQSSFIDVKSKNIEVEKSSIRIRDEIALYFTNNEQNV